MKKSAKILIIISVVLIFIGTAVMASAFILGGSFEREKTVQRTYYAEGSFSKISVSVLESDIKILPSDSGECYAVCEENSTFVFNIYVENDTLYLKENDRREWYHHIGIFLNSREAVLYLPEGLYRELDVKSSSGNIKCEKSGISFENVTASASSGRIVVSADIKNRLSADTSSGNIMLKNISLKALELSASSGDITLINTVSERTLKIETSSGEVELDRCDAGEIHIETSSGDVEAELLSDKLFDISTRSGEIECPPSANDGGRCTVATKSGDIEIDISN